MDNRNENNRSVDKMRQRSRELSKHLPKSSATKIKQLEKSMMNTVTRIQQLKAERNRLSDRSESSKKYKELTAGIKNNEQRAQKLLDQLNTLSPEHVDKLSKQLREPIKDMTEPIHKRSSGEKAPLSETLEKPKKEVSPAVAEANRKFEKAYHGVSKEPYANRQPKIKFVEKALENEMNRETGLQDRSSQKRTLTENQKPSLKDKLNAAHLKKEANHLRQNNQAHRKHQSQSNLSR